MKKILVILLAAALAFSAAAFAGVPADASASGKDAKAAADGLHSLGLMDGVGANADGTPDYNLGGNADRQTAATMLVRILGKKSAAESWTGACPFGDVSGWAKNYVAFASSSGYAKGYGDSSFGGSDRITAQQYITMVLRALGYTDSGEGSDFSYDTACAFAASAGLTDGSYTNATSSFTRGDIAIVSYSALNTAVKGSGNTLYGEMFGKPMTMASSLPVPEAQQAGRYENTAPGYSVASSADGLTSIDYSNCSDGYVMVRTSQESWAKLVVMITCPDGASYKYYYTSTDGVYEAFPLTAGSGTYRIGVYKNISGTKYATLYSLSIDAAITDELSPFLRPNFYVNYDSSTQVVQYADGLCADAPDDLAKVGRVFDYVVNGYTYDYDEAASVQTGYRPVLDNIFAVKKGICFDYAAVMTSMLRSQGVPTKLVVGYAGTVYHAWISVYTSESGWIESIIYFDGSQWRLMDPTFASNGNTSFASDISPYLAKYVY